MVGFVDSDLIIKANTNKTKDTYPVTLKGEPLEETDRCTYIGSTTDTNLGVEADVKASI